MPADDESAPKGPPSPGDSERVLALTRSLEAGDGPDTEIDREAVAFIETAPKVVRTRILARLIQTSSFQGPLPPPDMLDAYNKAVPNMGRELLDTFKAETAHRHALNEKQFASVERESVDDARERRLGMWLGLVVAMAFLFVSGWLIHEGHDIAGGVLGTVDLVGLVAIFVARERTEAARIEGDASDKGKKSPGRGDEE